MNRRALIAGSLGALTARALVQPGDLEASAPPTAVPMLHCTDLFRPFADPDDHFDVASLYALAARGAVDLRAILIDYPPPKHTGDPDVQAIAQLNAMTGLAVPVLIGSPRPYDPTHTRVAQQAATPRESPGARAILDVLRASPTPMAINIAGSSRDVAIAGRANPDLFARKCAAVYLNAGSGTQDPQLARRLEYNVELDPASFASIFSLPCPVYWLPCFEVGPTADGQGARAGPHASLYSFTQRDVLPRLSTRLQNYFAFAYRQGERKRTAEDVVPRADWLRTLDGPRNDAAIAAWGSAPREMWCTAGFIHAAGLDVAPSGSLGPRGGKHPAVFSFEPARVRCDTNGVTSWTPGRSTPPRYVLSVREQWYGQAMTAALLDLLTTLT